MTAWWNGQAVGFDLETDGPEPEDARIITANVTVVSEDGLVQPVDVMLEPERDIPEGATAVHGITTAHAKEHGLPREGGLSMICMSLASAGGDAPVVGHNLRYDLTLLDRELRRTGLGSLAIDRDNFATLGQVQLRLDGVQVAAFWVIDTMVLDKAVDTFRPGSRKLTDVAAHYRVSMGDQGAHDAGADVIAALRIAWRIARLCDSDTNQLVAHFADRRRPREVAETFRAVGKKDLSNLHAWLEKRAEGQAAGLADYWRANPDKMPEGADPDSVRGEWPFVPYDRERAGKHV